MRERFDEIPQEYVGQGYRLALQALARSALKELIAARGDGPWLTGFEQGLFHAFRNNPIPGVPIEFEPRVIDAMEILVEALVDEARGGNVIVID